MPVILIHVLSRYPQKAADPSERNNFNVATEEAKQAGVGRGSNKKQGVLYSREKKLIQRGAWGEKNKKNGKKV